MTHKRILQERCKHIFKIWATPRLHELHFKKRGNTYVRQLGRIQHLLTVELDVMNTAEAASFTVSCGVIVPGVVATMWKRSETMKPDAVSGLIHVRPALLSSCQNRVWWDLKASDLPSRDDIVGEEVSSLIESIVLPFFSRFEHDYDVAKFLEAPRKKVETMIFPFCYSQCVAYAGIIWDQLGEYDKSKECMARAAELAKGKRLEVDIEKFAREYVCGKLPRIESS